MRAYEIYMIQRKLVILACVVSLSSILFSKPTFALTANRVTGVVYDNRNNPLLDVDVELLSELGAFLQHTRTDSGGRYSFTGLAEGRFSVRVKPLRSDFQEATKDVYFSSFVVTGGTGSATEILDFNLEPRRNGLAYSENQVVFVQDVPDEAKKAFRRSENALKKGDQAERTAELEAAVRIFPTYFAALYPLGETYFARSDYGKAAHYLLRAADVNIKSPKSFYMLGYSFYMLKLYSSALVSLNQALVLSPASGEILLLLGTTEMKEGKAADAEKHLMQAKKVSETPNPEVYWQLSQLYGNYLKKYAEAADELENYLKAQKNITTPEQKKKTEEYKKMVKQLRDKSAMQKKS